MIAKAVVLALALMFGNTSGGQLMFSIGVTGPFTNNMSLSGVGFVETTGKKAGAIRFSDNMTLGGTLALTNDARVGFIRALSLSTTISGKVTGPGGLEFYGAHGANNKFFVLTLSNPGNDYAGTTTISTEDHNGTYSEKDNNWKTPAQVVKQLVEVVSKGGSFLLNVGPTAEGEIPKPAVDCLAQVGDWLKVNGESIYGATVTPLKGAGDLATVSGAQQAAAEAQALATGAGKAKKKHANVDYRWLATGREGKLYIHLFKWPAGTFDVKGISGQVRKAYFLSNKGALLTYTQQSGDVSVNLPAKAPDAIASVLCLEYATE